MKRSPKELLVTHSRSVAICVLTCTLLYAFSVCTAEETVGKSPAPNAQSYADKESATIKREKKLALIHIDQGMGEIEKGNYARGVSHFFAAYRSAPTAAHEPLPSSARNLIGGWSLHLGMPVLHNDWVAAVAFSPDGKTVLTGSYDNTARLWDAASGEPQGKTMQHNDWVAAVAFSPDGKTVLTGSYDNTARLWDAVNGEARGKIMQHGKKVNAVAFSPDGKTVLTGSDDKTARLWDAASGLPRGKTMKHQRQVGAVAFSPDGKTVLTGSYDNTARLWDAASGEPRGKTMQHGSYVLAVAFSPDGKTVLTGSFDNTARLWDAASGALRGKTMKHDRQVAAVAFGPDGKTVLTGSWDGTARLWDVTSPALDEHDQLKLSVEVRTRLFFDERGGLKPLTQEQWLKRWEKLKALGGPCDIVR